MLSLDLDRKQAAELDQETLTTIEQHLYNSGVEGAKMLIEILEGQLDTHCKQTIPLELIVRGTTAPAPN